MIVLTGATGFLGSALLEHLLRRGDEVVALKRSTSKTTKIHRCMGHPSLHLFDIDIQDPQHIFEQYRVDTIIHTATEYGRGETPLNSVLNANLLLPLRLAELGMKWGVGCFINTDSFFNKAGNSYSHLLHYSLSKKSLLIWLDKLAGNLRILNVILEHLYGPGDSPSKFVEQVVRRVGVEQIPHLALTQGYQVRDFVYLDDVVRAYMKLVDFGRKEDFKFESFEVGTGRSMQVREFVQQIKDLSGSPTTLGFGEIPYRRDEIMHSVADTSRLERLGWQPAIGSAEGLRRILEYYRGGHVEADPLRLPDQRSDDQFSRS